MFIMARLCHTSGECAKDHVFRESAENRARGGRAPYGAKRLEWRSRKLLRHPRDQCGRWNKPQRFYQAVSVP
jgi:hypothetical protein